MKVGLNPLFTHWTLIYRVIKKTSSAALVSPDLDGSKKLLHWRDYLRHYMDIFIEIWQPVSPIQKRIIYCIAYYFFSYVVLTVDVENGKGHQTIVYLYIVYLFFILFLIFLSILWLFLNIFSYLHILTPLYCVLFCCTFIPRHILKLSTYYTLHPCLFVISDIHF